MNRFVSHIFVVYVTQEWQNQAIIEGLHKHLNEVIVDESIYIRLHVI